MVQELPPDSLRKTCDPQVLACTTSAEMDALDTIIGQERAVRSLQFGLGIKELGFNIYVAGLPGSGRTTAVKRYLDEIAKERPVPPDWCYVNDFKDPERPKALRLTPGLAREFRRDMRVLVEGAKRGIRTAFESEEYAAKREQTAKGFQKQREEIFLPLNERAQKEGFTIQMSSVGLMTIPMKEGKPLSDEEFQSLAPEAKQELMDKRDMLQSELQAAIRQAKGLEKSANAALQKVDQEVALYALRHLMEDIKEKYSGLPDVSSYLDEVQADILENLNQFRSDQKEQQPQIPMPIPMPGDEVLFKKYEVNVLVDNSSLKGAPVVMELNPTYNNLFGRIEKEPQFGALLTDFTLIREGSLHRANGGFLVLPIEEVLPNIFSWDSLKRALRNKEIVIEEAGERLGWITTKSLRGAPIPLDVKVVLTGHPMFYRMLYNNDEDFAELFKVKADFDTTMDRKPENERDYAAFACTICREENLKHLDSSALAKFIEHGSRLCQDQEKLSTRFGEIADIIREASFYATQEGAQHVSAAHVCKAIEEKFYRRSLIRDKIMEMIDRGTIKIDTSEKEVGQVNGLSVSDFGDFAFGRPNRITVNVGLGRGGLVDIEREAKLGGPIHTKGVLILAGFLTERFAQDKPLSLSARLVFEQSYSGVEGDSASSTELYALLSSLSELPIRQGIAVTGSVNQKGEVQAIGGVNEKIEGFFEVCKAKGLNGEQGVLIPESNVKNLMLREEIVDAVGEGKFHIWPVKTIDEGIEVLTGVRAGERKDDGTYEEGTVNYLVDARLRKLAETLRDFGSKNNDKNDKKKDNDE